MSIHIKHIQKKNVFTFARSLPVEKYGALCLFHSYSHVQNLTKIPVLCYTVKTLDVNDTGRILILYR